MTDQITILVSFSEEIEEIFQQQHIDIYQIFQEELPEIKVAALSNPLAQRGEKSLMTVILTEIPAIILAISPIIIRTLNHFKPDTTEIRTEETEIRHVDGSTTIHKISVTIQKQYNQQSLLPSSQQKSLPPAQSLDN